MALDAPDVSVIIPVRDDPEGLETCLRALRAQTLDVSRFEVIVVDNASEPPVGAIEGVTVVREERPGSYAARNHGIAIARAPVLAFTDGDCSPRPEWLEAGLDRLRREPEAGVVAGRIEVIAAEDPTAAEWWELRNGFRQDLYVERRGYGATANLFVRREVVAEIGHFIPLLRSSGDLEFGMRATSRGRLVVYEADAVVEHPTRPSWGEMFRKRRRVMAGHAFLRHALGVPVPDRYRFRPRHTLGTAVLSWRALWDDSRPPRGRVKFAVAVWVVFFSRLLDRARMNRGMRREPPSPTVVLVEDWRDGVPEAICSWRDANGPTRVWSVQEQWPDRAASLWPTRVPLGDAAVEEVVEALGPASVADVLVVGSAPDLVRLGDRLAATMGASVEKLDVV